MTDQFAMPAVDGMTKPEIPHSALRTPHSACPPHSFIDPTAVLGAGTRVWHFAVILADVQIGENCSIGSHCEIGRASIIGNGSRIGQGVFLPPHSWVGNEVFIGPGVTCTDDKHPRVNNPNYHAQPPVIEDNASIGAGVILLPGVKIGRGAMIGAGSIVTRDVAPGAVLRGEPSRRTGQRETVRAGQFDEATVIHWPRLVAGGG